MSNTLTRNIYFYQIDWIEDDNTVVKDLKFFESILKKHSNKLVEYLEDSDVLIKNYNDLIDEVPKDTSLWKLSKIRKSGFPRIVDYTTLIDNKLDLKPNEGLYEPSHFIIIDGKFLLAEFNSYGARVQSTIRNLINNYLKENRAKLKESAKDKKSSTDKGIKELENIKKVQIKPILKEDAIERMEKFTEIRDVSIKVATDYVKRFKGPENKSIFEMLSSAQFVPELYLNLDFSLGRKKTKDSKGLFSKIINNIKLLYKHDDLNAENFEKVSVRGKIDEGTAPETLNLIEMFMKYERKILKLDDTTRAVDPKNMFRELLDSYDIYKGDLEKKYTREGAISNE